MAAFLAIVVDGCRVVEEASEAGGEDELGASLDGSEEETNCNGAVEGINDFWSSAGDSVETEGADDGKCVRGTREGDKVVEA